MTSKIVISVVIAFVISFSILAVVLYLNEYRIIDNNTITTDPDTYMGEKLFFSKNISVNENKVFLLGSSHMIGLNTTYIQNSISDKRNYHVYNLAIGSDHPRNRLDTIDMIISAKPKIVVYGIADRDFVSSIPINNDVSNTFQRFLPDPHQIFLKSILKLEKDIHLNLNFLISPKIVTLKAIQTVLQPISKNNEKSKWYPYPNTPFEKIDKFNTIIKNKDYLDNQLSSLNQIQFNQIASQFKEIPPPDENENLIALKEIITKLHANNIKVIVFTTPQNGLYLSSMPEQYRKSFDAIVENLSNNPDIKFYQLFDKYADLNIWADLNHVAINENTTIYSNDVSTMIKKEIAS